MNLRGHAVTAELTWLDGRFQPGVTLHISPEGVIGAIDRAASPPDAIRLHRRALMPGFVNAHSHAFQRALRATPQRFDAGAGDFWTWRQTMYRLAESLDVQSFYEASRRAFEDMLRAGITTVGEFHYLHHAGEIAEMHWAFDDALISAANDAGIRLVLIQTYYATGGVGRPLEGAQRRFGPVDRAAFMRQLESLAGRLDAVGQHTALACHSLRAVGLDEMRFLRDASIRNGWPFHIHVEEARQEIDDCRAAYGRGALATLLATIPVDATVTAIHCTHSTQDDLREYLTRGGRVCLCPLTEANLSDGFPEVPFIRSIGGEICFGTDCNLRVSAVEELRWLEFTQRLRRERRGVVVDAGGSSADALIAIGTRNGAAALGLTTGAITPGAPADLLAIRLDDPAVADAPSEALADAFIFGCGNGPIEAVWINGTPPPTGTPPPQPASQPAPRAQATPSNPRRGPSP